MSTVVKAALEVRGLYKSFDDVEVLRGIDLSLADHEVVCLIGASGSGKSTLLRCVNLLEPIDAGTILVEGEEITAKRVDVNRIRRRIGIVFQAFNLFPHMSVLANVTLAPRKVLGRDSRRAEADALALLDRFGLADKAREFPDRLSGGQQQRVAIVRALAMEPDLLLLDEITSALDPELVAEVLALIRELRILRHDDAHRHARDGLRSRHREPCLLPRRRSDPRGRATGQHLQRAAGGADAAVPATGDRGRADVGRGPAGGVAPVSSPSGWARALPRAVGTGVGGPGLGVGGLASSTTVPGRTVRTQPTSMWLGAYAADCGSRVG